jgi:predicted anti-sigma-YlaC factor YlaD
MLIAVPPSDCMRAREALSALLDGELSELEGARLDLHLRRCSDCRSYAVQVTQIVAELRRAPLHRIETPVFEPRRRRRGPAVRIQAAAAALAAAAAVGGAFALGHVLGGNGSPTAGHALRATADESSARADSLEQHLLAMLPHTGPGSLRLGPNIVAL